MLTAPLDVALDEGTVMRPDLLVARREDFTARDLPVAPLLAVEVLSPSTRRIDLTLKRSRYEAAGCIEVAHVTGEEEFAASEPYDVIISPAQLLG